MKMLDRWREEHAYPMDDWTRTVGVPKYAEAERRRPRLRFSRFRSGRPGGFWGVRNGTLHQAFGIRFYGAFGRLGWSLGVWPVWAIRFEGYLFPSRSKAES